LQTVPWYEAVFILKNLSLKELSQSALYQEGKIYLQGLSSMLPALVLAPKPGEKVLDLTAAPGSKTTQMASLMQNQGEIVAVEKVKPRFFKLKKNLELQGATCVKPILSDAERIWRRFGEYFDKVLLDAPCSSEAGFLISKPKTYAYWKKRKIAEMAHKQRRLLFSAVKALKLGGMLVYSTCTYAPEENEMNLEWLLEKFSAQMQMEEIELHLENFSPVLSKWQKTDFSPSLRKAVRVLPSQGMEGFFLAKLRKNLLPQKEKEAPVEVTCAILEKEGKILLCQRKADDAQALKWEFPGGKVKIGENPQNCLKRELKEELEVEVEVCRRLKPIKYRYPDKEILLLPFFCRRKKGEINASASHCKFAWVEKQKLGEYDLCPADRALLSQL
jgi:16S rRNA (cytosine1407-C5)-methyltransferase